MSDKDEGWLHDTEMECAYDSEAIEYMEAVVMLSVVAPASDGQGGLIFEPILIEEDMDFLYQPVFFQAPNWDRVEEDLQPILEAADSKSLHCLHALLTCGTCNSGILASETMGLLTFGIFERSNRSPSGRGYGCKFVADDRNHAVLCIACLRSINDEVLTIWEDGVCHDNECQAGTQTRCWRAGCAGACEQAEDEE